MQWQTTYLSGNDRDKWNYLPGSTIDLAPKENPPSSLPFFPQKSTQTFAAHFSTKDPRSIYSEEKEHHLWQLLDLEP